MSIAGYSSAILEMGARIGIAIVIVVLLGLVAVLLYLARQSIINFVTALLIRRREARGEGSSDSTTADDGRKRPDAV